MTQPMFHTPDLAELERLAGEAATREKSRKQFDDIRWYNVDDGTFTFLLTPPYSQRGLFEVRVFSHFNMPHTYIDDKDRSQKTDDRGVYCPQWSVPEKKWGCPICAVLSMLRMVSAQIQAANPDKDLNKAFQRVDARAYAYFNAIILTSVDAKGNPRLDGGQPLVGPLPRIVKGNAGLGDFILSSLREYGAQMYNPTGAIPLKVVRKRTGANPQDVKYEYQYVPGGLHPLAADADGLAAVAANLYDLDKVLNPDKKWTEEEWRRSAAKALEYVKRWGFKDLPMDRLPAFPPELREAQEKAKAARREGGGAESSTQHTPAPASPTPAMEWPAPAQLTTPAPPAAPASFYAPVAAAAPALAPATAPPPAAPIGLDLGAMTAGFAPQPAAAVTPELILVPAGPIVRDPARVNPATGAPECKGNHLGTDPACTRCPVLDVCMVETMERNVRAQA